MTHEFDHGVLYQGDCLDIMPNLPEKSVDMILADLPYGITCNQWDFLIPLGALWEQYERIIKDNGAIILTAQQPFTSELVLSNKKLFRYEWIWEKPIATGFMNAKKMPLKGHENILVFYKSLPVYHPQKYQTDTPSFRKCAAKYSTNYDKHMTEMYAGLKNGERYPRSVFYVNIESIFFDSSSHTRGTIHPTQKPVALFEYLIKTYTNEGETVLDNVIGSGTTAVAAYRTGRRWIGIEKDPEIYQKCLERIKKDTQQLNLISTANNPLAGDFERGAAECVANPQEFVAPLSRA